MIRTALIAALAACLSVNIVLASPINIHSTGNGSTVDGTIDPNWTFTNSGGTASARVAANAGTDFFSGSCCGGGPWAPNTTSSAWIVNNTGSAASGGTPLSFSTTFSMAGFDLASALITLAWGIDDAGTLALNGHTFATLGPGQSATSWQDLSAAGNQASVAGASGFFVAGTNTLTATLTSADNSFDGVNVRILSATANATAGAPEPSTIMLAATGLIVALLGRRWRGDRSPAK